MVVFGGVLVTPRVDDEIKQALFKRARQLQTLVEESEAELPRLGAKRRAAQDREAVISISGLAKAVSR